MCVTPDERKEKTPEEIRKEMYEKALGASRSNEYLTEVAIPGIGLPVDPKDLEK